jgi:hypothetical protein
MRSGGIIPSEGDEEMIFDKKIAPRCEYCRFGNLIDDDHVICVKRGVVGSDDACRRFRYDPLKRRPEIQPAFRPLDHNDDEFAL